MIHPRPGVRTNTYVSYMCSPYHVWFQAMGYPRLDLNIYEDGEWEIIEFLRTPVVPSLTPWHRVLMDIRHTEISYDFCKKYVENLDLEKRHVWDEMDRKDEQDKRDLFKQEMHVADFQKRAFQAVSQNPALMERIAKNGMQELSLRNLSRHIPNFRFRKETKKRTPHVDATLLHRTVTSGQDHVAGVGEAASQEPGTPAGS